MSCQILQGDCLDVLKTLESESVNCCVTSPPYWGLRDYGVDGQLGLEKSPHAYAAAMLAVFREVGRVLRRDGTVWLNLGDSYNGSGKARGGGAAGPSSAKQRTNRGAYFIAANNNCSGLKPKDLIGIPWRVAFALQEDGWYLRSDIIWHKRNCMPESVTDRPTRSHEYIFLLSKSQRYYYDAEAIKEPCSESFLNDSRHEMGSNGNHVKEGYALAGAQDSKGPHRLFGKTDKQRGHSRRHDGFNDRWDAMERGEQCSGTRNKRDVWTVSPAAYHEAHFATYPPDLIKPCILAGCPVGGTVLDPFAGSGTTGQVALEYGRNAILIELNPKYIALIEQRTAVTPGLKL